MTLERNHSMLTKSEIESILADSAEYLLNHTCTTIAKERLHLPSLRLLMMYFRYPIEIITY